jgi:hypothetical protein
LRREAMEVLVGVETLLLGLVVVLLAGLFRSHAELIRQVEQLSPSQPARSAHSNTAQDIEGVDLEGHPARMTAEDGGRKLLAFLTSGCLTCESFWRSICEDGAPVLPGSPELIVVTKDAADDSVSTLRRLAEGIAVPIVMSTAAWTAYEVPVSPYFTLVDGNGQGVIGEGAAESWKQVLSLVSEALADTEAHHAIVGGQPVVVPPSWKTEEVAEVLRGAGLRPGDPSLYSDRWSDDQHEA